MFATNPSDTVLRRDTNGPRPRDPQFCSPDGARDLWTCVWATPRDPRRREGQGTRDHQPRGHAVSSPYDLQFDIEVTPKYMTNIPTYLNLKSPVACLTFKFQLRPKTTENNMSEETTSQKHGFSFMCVPFHCCGDF